MKPNDIKLIIVFVVCVVCSGLVAKKLSHMQNDIDKSKGVSYASKVPVAGFNKFLADVYWMRFLNYAGSNQLDEKTLDRYEGYILKIISLDPDFFRIYRDGALFLGPIAPKRALAIVDMAQTHPQVKKRWELPLIAGQIIMRKEWRSFYKAEKVDLAQVKIACDYFRTAKGITNSLPTALNNYIRTSAMLEENGDPRELNELRAWCTEYAQSQNEMDDASGAYGGGSRSEIGGRVIQQIKKVIKKHGKNKKIEDEVKQIIVDYFPRTRFDAESFRPYPSSTKVYRGYIEDVKRKKYVIELDSETPFAVSSVTLKLAKGTAKVAILVDGKPVKGIGTDAADSINVTTKRASWPEIITVKVKKKDSPMPGSEEAPISMRAPMLSNKGRAGSVIEIQVLESGGAEDLNFVLNVFEGDYF